MGEQTAANIAKPVSVARIYIKMFGRVWLNESNHLRSFPYQRRDRGAQLSLWDEDMTQTACFSFLINRAWARTPLCNVEIQAAKLPLVDGGCIIRYQPPFLYYIYSVRWILQLPVNIKLICLHKLNWRPKYQFTCRSS